MSDVFDGLPPVTKDITNFDGWSPSVNPDYKFGVGYDDHCKEGELNFWGISPGGDHTLGSIQINKCISFDSNFSGKKDSPIKTVSNPEKEKKIDKYRKKRKKRFWGKIILYPCRQSFANSRERLGGKFVKIYKETYILRKKLLNN